MSDLVPFPLRVPQKMKDDLGDSSRLWRGRGSGRWPENSSILGYERRMAQLQDTCEPTEGASRKIARTMDRLRLLVWRWKKAKRIRLKADRNRIASW